MRGSKYVVVQMMADDLYAETFDTYDKALTVVEDTDEKAYIRIEDFCADAFEPITITLEPHT